jgi:hypothetical protein
MGMGISLSVEGKDITLIIMMMMMMMKERPRNPLLFHSSQAKIKSKP